MDMNAQSQVELRLQARHLPNKDMLSKTDALAVVYLTSGPPGSPEVELGRTEVVYDNLNPEWAAQIVVTYLFEVQQTITVKVYDEDVKGSADLSRHDFIGAASVSLGSLMCSAGQQKTLPVASKRSGSSASLVIRGEELAVCNDWLHVTFTGKKLANKDGMFGKSDPYISVKKSREDGTFVEVWKSDVVMDNLNPTWKAAKISVGSICNGDYDRPLRLDVYDWDKDGNHDLMGSAVVSVRRIIAGEPIELIEEKKKGRMGYKNSGHVVPLRPAVTREPSLSDYMKGGCRINLLVGIDFTGSNGNPSDPRSLHHLDPTGRQLNQYQQAILGIGGILKDYSTDGSFQCFGFGAALPNHQVSHCFPLTFADPRVMGVEGIMGAYMNCLPQVRLSGPTLFAPLLNAAISASSAPQSQQSQYYNVLLMITDGEINDMEETIAAVVSASSLPLSVIIIGVGQADFTNMNALDGDGGLLRSSRTGKTAVRDCVQFVPFLDFAGKHFSELAKATLAEVPGQLLNYFKVHQIMPNPPIPPPPPATAATAPPSYS